ncbi:MAG TPA: hypothetical protein VGQ94_02475 [Terriglobales bacterium]|nr:hypothetical protein [Terriglobales bacterium]
MGRFPASSLLAIAAAVLLLAGAGLWLRSRRKTPEQLERERRLRLNAMGRITDGTVLDVHEERGAGGRMQQLLIYRYDVAGVSYEASQEVAHLRHLVDLHSCRIGLPASVKYGAQNPGNSIVIAEGWTGLRK